MYGYYPVLAVVLSTVAGLVVSRTARLLLSKPLNHPTGCPRLRTRGMVYRRSGMRTLRFWMQMSTLMSIALPSSFGCCACHYHVARSLELLLPTTTPDASNAPQVFYPTPGDETHSLKDLELTVPRMPTVHRG